MSTSSRILAIDLGTSRVKVALVDEHLHTIAAASETYPTMTSDVGMAEQRPEDWLGAITAAAGSVLATAPSRVDAVVVTAQMPTLVALDAAGDAIGNAVTWQDSRADALVLARLDHLARKRVHEVAGTPIDGRYIIPMHLLRTVEETYEPAKIVSAKDYLYFVLTSELVTDPSTASGFGNFDLAAGSWSAELTTLWGIDSRLLPRVADSHFHAALSEAGAAVVAGVAPGTPVVLGAADSVCAHHFITSLFDGAVSVIDGSSTVIMATLPGADALDGEVLLTPLVDPSMLAGEMDLLATGSSIAWLAQLLALAPDELEELALTNPRRAENPVLFLPYLAGGEQGVIWRSDLAGSIDGLSLSSSRADLALALFEGIAIETARCIEMLGRAQSVQRVVSVSGPRSRHLGASLLGALANVPVLALAQQSPSLLGAALIAIERVADQTITETIDARALLGELPHVEPAYRDALVAKSRAYLEVAAHAMGPEITKGARA
ncbi:MAG: xylulokinase [Acidimicrobiales bacterium]